MSPKLPVVSGDDLIRVLEKIGYVRVRQKGSHVRLRHSTEPQRKQLTIPLHKTLKRGLLRHLLTDARISVEKFSTYLWD
jgi:predicted RNA binding protein YcfA (HicA-like mRNA interferase family)